MFGYPIHSLLVSSGWVRGLLGIFFETAWCLCSLQTGQSPLHEALPGDGPRPMQERTGKETASSVLCPVLAAVTCSQQKLDCGFYIISRCGSSCPLERPRLKRSQLKVKA